MPIYEYRCKRGHTFEVLRGFSDDPVSVCEVCDQPVQRVFHPVAVHFKGSGFYNTDYGTRKRSREMSEAKESNGGESSKDKKADSKSSEGKGGSDGKGSAADSGTKKKTETKAAAAD